MARIALLGDSIFDNAPYTAGGPAVIDHLRQIVPADWGADLLAVDGSVATDVAAQLQGLEQTHTHIVLSVGGNDTLMREDILDTDVSSSSEALLMLSEATATFEVNYRAAVAQCLGKGLPMVVCTIYNCNFPTAEYQRVVAVALSVYNGVIIRVALDNGLRVIELRRVCNAAEDYANPIEPSVAGGRKIALAILCVVRDGRFSGEGSEIAA